MKAAGFLDTYELGGYDMAAEYMHIGIPVLNKKKGVPIRGYEVLGQQGG